MRQILKIDNLFQAGVPVEAPMIQAAAAPQQHAAPPPGPPPQVEIRVNDL